MAIRLGISSETPQDALGVRKVFQFLALLGVNAVPALGWFVEGWSAGTTLAIYWFENVAACLFIGLRIFLHRRWHPCRGHFRYQARRQGQGPRPAPAPFLGNFLQLSLVFSAAHGFFLGMLLFLLNHNGKVAIAEVSWPEMRIGCGNVLLFLAVSFLADLRGLAQRPFAWVERLADWNFGRIIVVHLTLIFGMFAVAMTGATKAFFGVFVVLKTMADLSAVIPQWQPKTPPRWLSNMMNKVPNAHPGEKFEDFWVKDNTEEETRVAANEQPWTSD
jgi:hypothetical protein